LSVDSSASTRPARSSRRRPAAFLAAGVAAAALVIAAPLAAQAAPSATVTSNVSTASGNAYVTLTAAGFLPDEDLTVTLDGSAVDEYVEGSGVQDVADSTGAYVTDVYIPAGTTLGAHNLTVTGGTTAPASTSINIVANPTASVTPASVQLSAYQSTGVTATFTGFPAGAAVEFHMASSGMGDGIGTGTADSSGAATVHFVPTAGSGFDGVGTYAIGANTTDDSITSNVQFTVTANAVVAPTAPVADPATPVTRAASFTG
jgi:hypothetical protein